MTRLAILNSDLHKDLRVNPSHGLDLGDGDHVVPVMSAEITDLAADIPVVVVRDAESGTFNLAALLGFEPGENLFVEGSSWLALHKPVDLQRRPFFAQGGDDGVEMLIDLDSPRAGQRGEPLFDPDGTPSPFLDHMRAMLAELVTGQAVTRMFIDRLLDLNLLKAVCVSVDFADGTRALDGILTINRDGLDALPDAAIVRLFRSGELELIHLMLASFGHLPNLVKRKEWRLEQQGLAANR